MMEEKRIGNHNGDYYTMEETMDSLYVATLKDSQLMQDLLRFQDFYKNVAYNCFLFLPKGTKGACNYDSYLYESLAGTISSIHTMVEKGHLNDACVLLRLYFDNILTQTYIHLLAEQKFDVFTNFYVNEICEWLQKKNRIPSIKKILAMIETSDKTKTIYSLVNKNDRLKTDREFLDDCVHGNRYQYFLYNCSAIYLKHRDVFLSKIQTVLNTLFVLHLSFIFSLTPHYLTASDYRDCLEMGMTPPEGSEYWIAPFAQEIFDTYIKPNSELANYLCTICSLKITR